MIIWPGAATLVASVMLTSISKSLYQLILTQGILGGIGISMIYTPCIAVLGHYFQKRRFLAIGLSSAGSSLGGIIFPISLYRLLFHSDIGFGWAVRIVGFIQLGLLLFACTTLVPRIPPRKNQFLLLSAFKRPVYSLQIAGLCLVFWGQYTPFFFLPAFVIRQDVPVSWSFYIIAIMNAGSFIGRLVSSHLARYVGNFNILLFGICSTGILLFCWIRMTTFGAIITFSILYGYTTGTVFGLCPGTMAMLAPHPNQIGTYVGMGMGVLGVFALTGSPVMGAVLSASHGNFVPATAFSGALVLTGSVIVGVARYWYAPRHLKA
jgi:MFS family permease